MQKVLFFDDEPAITGYLIKNLEENLGWKGDKKIVLVSTVGDLLNEINNMDENYSLFVLDVMAPISNGIKNQFSQDELNKMDGGMLTGYVMAGKIRTIKKEEYKTVPILYLSARTIPPIPDTEKGYTTYIRKPVSPEEISKKMNELLEKQKTN